MTGYRDFVGKQDAFLSHDANAFHLSCIMGMGVFSDAHFWVLNFVSV